LEKNLKTAQMIRENKLELEFLKKTYINKVIEISGIIFPYRKMYMGLYEKLGKILWGLMDNDQKTLINDSYLDNCSYEYEVYQKKYIDSVDDVKDKDVVILKGLKILDSIYYMINLMGEGMYEYGNGETTNFDKKETLNILRKMRVLNNLANLVESNWIKLNAEVDQFIEEVKNV
jgi:hypothetical protein